MARKDFDGLFQVGILLLAGLWGVAVVKKGDRLRWKDKPEITMFAASATLLGAFLFVDQRYAQLLERLYWDIQPSIGDRKLFIDLFDSPYISLYRDSLFRCLYGGIAASAIFTFSLCLLRGSNRDQ